MPTHKVLYTPPGVQHTELVAANDGTASPTGMQKVASAFNYISCTQKKVILVRAQDHTATISSGTTNSAWAHYFRTGEGTTSVVARIGCCGVTSGTAGTLSYDLRTFSTGDTSDTLIGQVVHHLERTDSSATIVPSDVARRTILIEGLSANTEYHGLFTLNNSVRLVYATVHEAWEVRADDSVTGVCSPDKFHAEGPIYDEHAQDLTEANNKLWRHNGSPYIGWAPDYVDTGAPTCTSAGFTDVISSTKTPGFYIDSTYHTTRNRTTVPVKMGVRCRSSIAATAEFRLTDGTNNIDITGVSVPATARWFTTTSTIPVGTGTWRAQAKRVSGGTVEISGWSLFPYEA